MLPRSSLAFVPRPVALLTGSLLFPLALHAQSYKLVGPFPPGPGGGNVRELRVDPAGTRIVYLADESSFDVVELYSAPADGSAPRVKLNGPLVFEGDVAEHGFAISPDGTRVVYRADQEADEVYELYSVPIDGSASPVKLNGTLAPGGDVGGAPDAVEFAISAGGTRVVYRADQTSDERYELYSAPLDGSAAAIPLSPSLPASADVDSLFLLASGPARAVFLADALVDGRFELFSVPIDGSAAPVRLVELPASNLRITAFALTPDGSRAAYIHLTTGPQAMRIFSVPVDGSAAPLELTSTPANHIESLRLTPDGSRVVYRAVMPPGYELFSVPLDGSAAPVRLDPLIGLRQVVEGSYHVTADGARVLYLTRSVDDVFELWSAPSDGSASPVRLNGVLPAGGRIFGVHGVAEVTAGERVVYVADEEVPYRYELYSVPADGSGSRLKLNGPLASNMFVGTYSSDEFVLRPPFGSNHARVIFQLSTVLDFSTYSGFTELYSVPIDASASPVVLSEPPVPGTSAGSSGWVFAGDRVVSIGDEHAAGVRELCSAPLDGSPGRVKLNGPMCPSPPFADAIEPRFTGDGLRVVYLADTELDGQDELYSVLADGSGSPVKLNRPLGNSTPYPSPYVDSFELSPDGAWVVFSVLWNTVSTSQFLYTAPTDGSTPAVELEKPYYEMSDYRISPDSRSVVYAANDQLFRAPLDGSSAPLPLVSRVAGSGIRAVEISPDSSRVVFIQDRDVPGRFELYSVPLYLRQKKLRPGDESDVPVKLNPALVAGGDVGDPFLALISPDGTRVVYLADQEVDDRLELYSVPITGGLAVKLNGPLVSGGDVLVPLARTVAITPDGARVLYVADEQVDERFELFSVPITGGTAVQLNGNLVAGGDVRPFGSEAPFLITPDSARVLYLADEELDERFELYSVPVPGGPAIKLNGELVANGDVRFPGYEKAFVALSPDGRTVVYEADQELDERFELYRRPVDGGGSPAKLNGTLPSGGAVGDFELSADGLRVVYRADQDVDGVVELFKAPLTGGPSTKLSGPLVEGGDVYQFALSPDGQRVVYDADQDTNDVLELYACPLERASGPGPHSGAAATPTRTVTRVH